MPYATFEPVPVLTGSLLRGFSAVDLMAAGAKDIFSIEIPAEVRRTWRSLMDAIIHLDAGIDGDYGYKQESDPLRAIRYLAGDDENPPDYSPQVREPLIRLRTDIDTLGLEEKNRRSFADHAEESIMIDANTPSISSVESLAYHLIQKGGLCGLLFADVVPNRDRGAHFPELENWLFNVGAAGEVLDGICDLREDYENGQSQILPTLRNRILLGYTARIELTAPVAKSLHSPKMIGRLGVKSALIALNHSGRFNKYRTK